MKEHRKVEDRLKKILRKYNIKFKKEEFGLINIFNHKSLDSLQLLSILTEIERTFDIKFSVKFSQNDKSNKIENIIDNISRHLKKDPSNIRKNNFYKKNSRNIRREVQIIQSGSFRRIFARRRTELLCDC